MEQKEYKIMSDIEGKHWWFRARRKIVSSMIEELNLSQNAQILEVGCGTGGNLAMLAEFGDVYAVELNKEAAKFAEEKKVAKSVIQAKLPQEVPYKDKKFDLIVFLDVVEHIEEDKETLKAINGILSDNGVLLITVPAFQFLWSEHDVALHHKRRYNKAQLKALIANSGYKTKYVSYYNFVLFPLVSAIRFMNNSLGIKSNESDSKMPGKFVNFILEKLFASERIVLGKFVFPFGVSLILTAVKN